MGVPKKKDGQMAIFLKSIFGTHLWGIPISYPFCKLITPASMVAGAAGAMPRLKYFGPGPGGASAPAEIFGPGPGGAIAPATNSGPGPGGAIAPGNFFGPGFAGAMPGLTPGPGRRCKYDKNRPIGYKRHKVRR